MSDPFEKMKTKIKGATAAIIGSCCYLLIILIYPKLLQYITNLFSGQIQLLIWISTGIIFIVASFFILADIHNLFDRIIFKQRQKIDNFIINQLIIPCNQINCNKAKKKEIKDEKHNLMNLFYTFIPNNDTERYRAFNYWGDYFITVNAAVFYTITLIISLIYIAIQYYFNKTLKSKYITVILILIGLSMISNILRQLTKKKLIYPTQAQIKRILTQDRNRLEKRLPQYRSNCQDDCPLTHNNGENKK
ncbi:MAG: hypothetical protein ACTSPW_20700 [Promethearchaeota archaeon]